MLSLVTSEIICCRSSDCCIQKFCFTAVYQSLLPTMTKSGDEHCVKESKSDQWSYLMVCVFMMVPAGPESSCELEAEKQQTVLCLDIYSAMPVIFSSFHCNKVPSFAYCKNQAEAKAFDLPKPISNIHKEVLQTTSLLGNILSFTQCFSWFPCCPRRSPFPTAQLLILCLFSITRVCHLFFE